jgi:hypothetical protein
VNCFYTDVAEIQPEDALVARADADGRRWYRCPRYDSWLPLLPPTSPAREHLPPRKEMILPCRLSAAGRGVFTVTAGAGRAVVCG